jgi:hypothetical protein
MPAIAGLAWLWTTACGRSTATSRAQQSSGCCSIKMHFVLGLLHCCRRRQVLAASDRSAWLPDWTNTVNAPRRAARAGHSISRARASPLLRVRLMVGRRLRCRSRCRSSRCAMQATSAAAATAASQRARERSFNARRMELVDPVSQGAVRSRACTSEGKLQSQHLVETTWFPPKFQGRWSLSRTVPSDRSDQES